MLLTTLPVKNQFGQHYKIQTSRERPVAPALIAEVFRSDLQANRFARSLITPLDFWLKIVKVEGRHINQGYSHNAIMDEVAQLFKLNQLKAYKVSSPSPIDNAYKKCTITDTKKNNYLFIKTNDLLLTNPKEVKTFRTKNEAKKYIAELGSDSKQIQQIAQELGLKESVNSDPLDVVADGLATGTFAIIVNQYSAPPLKEKEVEEGGHQDKDASKGPEEEKTPVLEKEKPPECLYHSMTLTCRHGRSVTLDPSHPPKDGALERLQIVSSQNEALNINGTPIFDILTVDADITDVCPNHQTNFITIGDSDATLIGGQINGKLAKFKSPSKALPIGNGVFKYLWLPNVEKEGVKHYKVSVNNSCDFSHFEGKAKSIQVDVYPYMKWSLKFDVSLGKITNDSKPRSNPLAFSGGLTLQQDNAKAEEFSVDYKKKLQVFEKTLNNFENILHKHIFNKFKEGRDIIIDVTLPKVALSYDTQFAEKPGSNLVVRTHEFNFEAAPFIKVAASVDILPILVAYLSSWWSKPFNAFFEWVKQKYGELAGKDEIEASISFKVSIEGDLGAKFSHSRKEDGTTSTVGEPVKSKITIKAEGEAKMDGHIYVVKVEVLLKAGIESSIEIGLSMGSDDVKDKKEKAPYVALDFMFNGVKVYLEKEVQIDLGKDTKEGKSKSNSLYGNKKDNLALPDISVKEVQKYEKVWLKMSKKHQFKYHLDSDDQEDIQ